MEADKNTSLAPPPAPAPELEFEVTIFESFKTRLTVDAMSAKAAERKALNMDYELDLVQRDVTVCRKN